LGGPPAAQCQLRPSTYFSYSGEDKRGSAAQKLLDGGARTALHERGKTLVGVRGVSKKRRAALIKNRRETLLVKEKRSNEGTPGRGADTR